MSRCYAYIYIYIYIYIHLVNRPGTRRDFQSSRLQAELIPKKIRKFGKREPQMKLAVAGSYVQAEGSELLADPLETRSRGSIVAELLNKIYDGIRYNEITSDMRGPSRFLSHPPWLCSTSTSDAFFLCSVDKLHSENPTDLLLKRANCF